MAAPTVGRVGETETILHGYSHAAPSPPLSLSLSLLIRFSPFRFVSPTLSDPCRDGDSRAYLAVERGEALRVAFRCDRDAGLAACFREWVRLLQRMGRCLRLLQRES